MDKLEDMKMRERCVKLIASTRLDIWDILVNDIETLAKEIRREALEDAALRCEREAAGILKQVPLFGLARTMADTCKSCANGIRALSSRAENRLAPSLPSPPHGKPGS